MKKIMKLLASTLFLLIVSQQYTWAISIISEERKAEVRYTINENHKLELKSSDKNVEINTWNKNEVLIEATVVYKGDDSEQIREFLDDFQEIVETNITKNSNFIEVNANLNEPNKFEMGSKLFKFVVISYNKKELNISYTLTVPSYLSMKLKNSYEDLRLNGEFTGNVEIDHYSGDFEGGKFSKLKATLKYGDAEIDEVEKGEFNLYEQDLDINMLGDGLFDAKYSEIELDQSGSFSIAGYETDITINSGEKVLGTLKYGKIEVTNNFQSVELTESYESEFIFNSVENFKIEQSKYSGFEISEAGNLTITSSYEDDFNIGTIGNILLKSKYAKFNIERITSSLEITEAYETDLDIKGLDSGLSKFLIDGKYCKVYLIDTNLQFGIDLDAKYANISYPEDSYEKRIYIKEGSQLKVELDSKTNSKTKIIVRGYEMDLTVRE